MVVLGQRWAEAYMKRHPETSIQVTGGGSGTGISALINGTTDICEASRAMKDAEKKQLQDKGAVATEIPGAKDGLSVYVNAVNPVKALTMAQLKDIFTGKNTSWKELGLRNGDYRPRAQARPGTAAVVNAVSKEKFGIGYGGAAYAKGIKVLPVKKDSESVAIGPSEATVRDGSYPLSRPLFFYVRGVPSGEAKSFIDWVLGPDGQKIAQEVGYYPIK